MPEEYDPLNTAVTEFDPTTDPEVELGIKPAPEATPDASAKPDPAAQDQPDLDPPDSEAAETPADETGDADGGELKPDEELAELGFPALPADLAANPDIAKRYHETQFGIQKVLRQQQDIKGELEKYTEVTSLLENPATVREAFEKLAQVAHMTTGVDPLAAYRSGATQGREDEIDLPGDWEDAKYTVADYKEATDLGFQYPGEYRAYKLAEKRFEERFGAIDKEREQTRAQAEAQTFLDSEAPKVMGYLAKTEQGWPVTKDMVAAALKQFPNMRDDLPRAVKMAYADEFAAHKAQAVLKAQGKEGPELLTKGGSSSRGVVLPEIDIETISTVDLIHKIAESQEALNR